MPFHASYKKLLSSWFMDIFYNSLHQKSNNWDNFLFTLNHKTNTKCNIERYRANNFFFWCDIILYCITKTMNGYIKLDTYIQHKVDKFYQMTKSYQNTTIYSQFPTKIILQSISYVLPLKFIHALHYTNFSKVKGKATLLINFMCNRYH